MLQVASKCHYEKPSCQKNKTCFEKLNQIQKRSVVNKCQKVNEQTNKQHEKQNKSQKGGQKQIEKKKHQGKMSFLFAFCFRMHVVLSRDISQALHP